MKEPPPEPGNGKKTSLFGEIVVVVLGILLLPIVIFVLLIGVAVAKVVFCLVVLLVLVSILPLVAFQLLENKSRFVRYFASAVAGVIGLPIAVPIWLLFLGLIGWMEQMSEYIRFR